MVGGDHPVRLYAFFKSRPATLKFFWKLLDSEEPSSWFVRTTQKAKPAVSKKPALQWVRAFV
jgi:hypothetical protein